MAKRTNLDVLYLGTDQTFDLTVMNDDETEVVDITNWAISFIIKKRATDPDSRALVRKRTSNGTIVINGLYHPDPVGNTLSAVTTIADTETDFLTAQTGVYEWKRVDPGYEEVLAFGTVPLVRSVHHG